MPSSNRPGPYHRFIPSEEVLEVAAWEFAPVDPNEAARVAQQAVAEQAPETAPPDEQLEALRHEAYAEGFEQGRLAGAQETRQMLEAPLRQKAQEQAQRLTQLLANAQADLEQLEDTIAAQMLELACDLARQVVRRELSTPLEPLKAAVQEALALLVEDGKPATLRLHPDDLKLLQEDLREPLNAMKVQLQADGQITRGGCIVESHQGAVDATVEKRWARAVANLGLQVPWQPGEQADV